MKPKAKTLNERHGFLDPDRSSGEHDKIQAWVFENLDLIVGTFSRRKDFQITARSIEYPIVQESLNYKAIVGFIDVRCTILVVDKETSERQYHNISFEIKNTIPSCGELVRQINFYRQFDSCPTSWIVVCSDSRFSDIIQRQGILFFQYSAPRIQQLSLELFG